MKLSRPRVIFPTSKHAREIVGLLKDDLETAGLSEEQALTIADQSNHEHIIAQKNNLLRHPRRYLGITAVRGVLVGELQGVVKYNDWRAADQQPYAYDQVEHDALQWEIEAGRHELPGLPLGIFALLVSKRHPGSHEIYETLLDAAIERADSREIRMGMPPDDPMLPLLEGRGFTPTDRIGEPIPGIAQRLYVRSLE